MDSSKKIAIIGIVGLILCGIFILWINRKSDEIKASTPDTTMTQTDDNKLPPAQPCPADKVGPDGDCLDAK